jgi:hypothetical protein
MTWPPSTIIPIPRHECELIIRGRKAEGGLEKAIHFDASGALATFPARAARPGALTHLLHRVGGSCSFPVGCDFENGLVTRFLSTGAELKSGSAWA